MISFSNIRPKRPYTRGQATPESTDNATVLTQSKKIVKLSKNSAVSTPKSDSGKQKTANETYTHEERENIVSLMRQKIISHVHPKIKPEDLETFDYLQYIKSLTSEVLDMLIIDIIPQYKPELVLDKVKLGQLRKKIKGWFTSRQNTNTTTAKGKRSAMQENEIRELNQIVGGAPGYNYGTQSNEYMAKMEDMYAKAPIVFEPNMFFNQNIWTNNANNYGNNPYYYYPGPQPQGNKSVGEMIEYNGLTTRSNSPMGSPISLKEETQNSGEISFPIRTSYELEQDWIENEDEISKGFWNSAKKLYKFGESLGISGDVSKYISSQ